MNSESVQESFQEGCLFLYPTEAVIGIGCDPWNEQAVANLCEIKNRPLAKGVILVAANYSQVLPFVKDSDIPMDRRTEIFSSWPGPNTWLLPKSDKAPSWITGEHELIAIRITNHPIVVELCQTLNSPIVSTSANLAGEEACRSIEQAKKVFPEAIAIEGETQGLENPSVIRNGMNGQVIRGA